MNDSELREAIKEIHERLHGRQQTHREVAKRSGWTNLELHGVLKEDYILFESELLDLFLQYSERVKKPEVGHWFSGGYGRDANGLYIGYKCNCGFKAENKSTIHSHVDWMKARLTNNNKGDK